MLELVGKPLPKVYSADLSEFVFAAGVKIMARDRPDVMYLSTTDYVQHKHAPGTPAANDFYAMMSGYLAQLDAMGVTIALTADHGMNAKTDAAGAPQIIYLQDWFDAEIGAGAGARDPAGDRPLRRAPRLARLVRHRLPAGRRRPGGPVGEAAQRCAASRWCCRAPRRPRASSCRPTASATSSIVSERLYVIGTSPSRHDLSGLDAPLRSHGGISEQLVPLLFNRPLSDVDPQRRLRNFDIFDLALNHAA